jgi:hypothetical protein
LYVEVGNLRVEVVYWSEMEWWRDRMCGIVTGGNLGKKLQISVSTTWAVSERVTRRWCMFVSVHGIRRVLSIIIHVVPDRASEVYQVDPIIVEETMGDVRTHMYQRR